MNWLETHITLQNYDDKKAERENAATHFFGAAIALAALLYTAVKLKTVASPSLRAGLIIYSLSNLLLFLASAIYHVLPRNNVKRVFRILDHANIYFLIAGTYTPILLYTGTRLGIIITLIMYLIAALGVTFTLFFWGRLKPLHVVLYLIMGWMIVFFRGSLVPYLPKGLMFCIIGGGITYTVGVFFYAIKKIPHYHAIWHLFVVGGSLWYTVGFIKFFL
jgi:Predicted membrane protein, hemolysin III homolog